MAEDILMAVRDVRRIRSGGLLQITLWYLKRAPLANTNEDCATTASHIASLGQERLPPTARQISRRIKTNSAV